MKAQPLILYGVNNTADQVILANLQATMARGYTSLRPNQESGPVSIVGSGPSLAWTYGDLVGDVIACNSAHDFLVSKGIVPKFGMIWDAHPIMEKMITPHKGVKYLLASRCHQSVFEKFKGFDVTVWHALGDACLPEVLNAHKKVEIAVAGGSSSVMRGTHLAGAMGYTKEMHLFGVDSSYSEEKTHISGSLIEQQKIEIMVCGKKFSVAPWMAMQATDFKALAPLLKANGQRLVVHGTGLIPYIATFMGIETPDVRVSLLERLRRNLHAVGLLYSFLRTPQLLGGLNAGY